MALFISAGKKWSKLAEIVLPGQHNLENILAAVAAVKLKGASNEAIQTGVGYVSWR